MSLAQRVLRVVVVDDHPVVREGLRSMLSSDPGIEVVGEAGSGEEAVDMVEQMDPHVVLVDIRMPGMNGIEVTRRIKEMRPDAAVIVLTMYDSEMYVVEALRAGAAGYLAKDCSRELLCHTINAAVDGGTMIRSGLLQQVLQGMPRMYRQPAEGQVDPVVTERFTARELDVIRLVARGHANREIARELSLAEVTVKKHVQSVIGKLGVSDRTHAAIVAVRLGLAE